MNSMIMRQIGFDEHGHGCAQASCDNRPLAARSERWTESRLTEPWAEYSARRKREREQQGGQASPA